MSRILIVYLCFMIVNTQLLNVNAAPKGNDDEKLVIRINQDSPDENLFGVDTTSETPYLLQMIVNGLEKLVKAIWLDIQKKEEERRTGKKDENGDHKKPARQGYHEKPYLRDTKYGEPRYHERPYLGDTKYEEPRYLERPYLRDTKYEGPRYNGRPYLRDAKYEGPKYNERPYLRDTNYEEPTHLLFK